MNLFVFGSCFRTLAVILFLINFFLVRTYLANFLFFLAESPWSEGLGAFCLSGVVSHLTCLAHSLARRPPRLGDAWLSGPVCEDAQLLMEGVTPSVSCHRLWRIQTDLSFEMGVKE